MGNDYLGAVLSGTVIDGVTVTPLAPFTADINTALTTLKNKQSKGIVFGVVDVTSLPFATTLPPFLTSGGKLVLNPATGAPIPLLGPKGCGTAPACPIPANTIVTLNAAAYLPSGFGIPCAVAPLPNCNKPLPAAAIDSAHPGALIYAADVAFLKQRGADYNTAIKAAAAASGYKYYDVNDFLLRLKAGFDIGGATVNAAFLTGGAFSYDGFHLTPIGYALRRGRHHPVHERELQRGPAPRESLDVPLQGRHGRRTFGLVRALRSAERRGLRKGRSGNLHARVRPAARVDVLFPEAHARAGRRRPGSARRTPRHRGIEQP